ncbi:MAG: hypothetical protein CM1200mP29_14650 [Verrucomicrobiota bacterium]|nr:MAG: hypothetical protein CM1200mP29_14650 [Verrucomicrobiota bacterium]
MRRREIEPGDWVHTHNVELRTVGRDYRFCDEITELPALDGDEDTFLGFARPGGKAGTRNYIGVISSVNCSASVSRYVADRFRSSDFKSDFPNVDGVVAFTHKGGCSYDPNHGHKILQRVIAGMARHPNIGVMCWSGWAARSIRFPVWSINIISTGCRMANRLPPFPDHSTDRWRPKNRRVSCQGG